MENTITDSFELSINLTLEIGRFSRLQPTEELIKPLRDESSQRIAEILRPSEKPTADNQEDFATRLRKGNVLDEIAKFTEEYSRKG